MYSQYVCVSFISNCAQYSILIPGYKDITLHIFFLVLFGKLKVLSCMHVLCFPIFVWTVHFGIFLLQLGKKQLNCLALGTIPETGVSFIARKITV